MFKLSYTITFLFLFVAGVAASQDYLTVKPKSGDGVNDILIRYNLPINQYNIDTFRKLNKNSLGKNDNIVLTKSYKLPVQIVSFNGKSIRSSISNDNMELAKKVENYNKKMWHKGLKPNAYKQDNIIWMPLYFLEAPLSDKAPKDQADDDSGSRKNGKKFKSASGSLSGCVFYLDPGHGGPDPGAIGYKNGNELHEDEYAYDITMRLAKKLEEKGAKVYMLVIDDNDGIRDDIYLKGNYDEYYLGGDSISHDLNTRLRQRASIVNRLYQRNKSKDQYTITIHVDSRVNDKRIDIFYYFKEGDEKSKSLASTLLSTVEAKYNKAQPGRGYKGTVTSRSLYMLRNTVTTSVYIELANIQNPNDQYRIIDPNNRQAIANWLADGVSNFIDNR